MILVTTSHKPSPRTRTFVKDLVSVIPHSARVNRGHKSLDELALEARKLGLRFFAIVEEKHGNPSTIDIYEVVNGAGPRYLRRRFLKIVLKGARLSRENPGSGRAYGVKSVSIDYSKCLTGDCFLLADALIKILEKVFSDVGDLRLVLEENDGLIELKWLNVHGRAVGPLIKISKVVKSGEYGGQG